MGVKVFISFLVFFKGVGFRFFLSFVCPKLILSKQHYGCLGL